MIKVKKNNEFMRLFLIGLAAFFFVFLVPAGYYGTVEKLFHTTAMRDIRGIMFQNAQKAIAQQFHNLSLSINDLSYWFNHAFSRKYLKNFKMVGIAIDDYSLSRITQRWPWRRTLYAQLLNNLDKEGVSVAGIDLVLKGESDITQDDDALTAVLKNIKTKVVLASIFDYKSGAHILSYDPFSEACFSVGIVDTPSDSDRKTRRLRSFKEFGNKIAPSFTAQVAAAFLGKDIRDVISSIPLSKDKTFFVNYLIKGPVAEPLLGGNEAGTIEQTPKNKTGGGKSGDILAISFYDALENMGGLKKKYGSDFLKGALVLVYPEAEIIHDIFATPLGVMPGGILNANGIADIVLGRFLVENSPAAIVLGIFSFAAILLISK